MCQTFKMRPPSTLDEQITNVLSDLDAELCAQETRLEKTSKIKQTMSRGCSSKIRGCYDFR